MKSKVQFYLNEANRLNLFFNQGEIEKIVGLLMPSIFLDDAELVSTKDINEVNYVKNFFFSSFPNLTEDEIDQAFEIATKALGISNRKKYRVIFYAVMFKKLDLF